MTRVTTVADGDAAGELAARQIAFVLRDVIERRGVAHFSLAGGNTPRGAYEHLSTMVSDWSAIELWYGDERCVDPEDEQSNHHLVSTSLLARISGSPPIEHRIRGELGAEAAAEAYSLELLERVPPAEPGEPPALDVALLGLGEDGHTASLFPGHPEVNEDAQAPCLAVHNAPKPPPDRVTLSLPVLRAARHCLLLAVGANKADAVAAVLEGQNPSIPASFLSSGRLHIVVDEAAASTR
jgi:6-phosphogluconolactonase